MPEEKALLSISKLLDLSFKDLTKHVKSVDKSVIMGYLAELDIPIPKSNLVRFAIVEINYSGIFERVAKGKPTPKLTTTR